MGHKLAFLAMHSGQLRTDSQCSGELRRASSAGSWKLVQHGAFWRSAGQCILRWRVLNTHPGTAPRCRWKIFCVPLALSYLDCGARGGPGPGNDATGL